MKRILFYTENFCDASSKGGLEVATYRIAKSLQNLGGFEAYHAFRRKSDGKEGSIYKDVVKLPPFSGPFEKRLANFIRNNKIDIVVNMTRFFRHKSIYKASKNVGDDVKVIFMQHFAPGSEMKKGTFRSGFHLLKLNPYNPLYWLRSTFYPLLKMSRNVRLKKIYRTTYHQSDKVVLLSKGYKEDYKKIAGLNNEQKFISIPNIFEREKSSDGESLLREKQKKVLILSLMDEIQKLMSLALNIWKKIENHPELNEWQLEIVGSGHNTDIVKRLIRKLKLKNVTYHGWKPGNDFLKNSSILISTSEYEGLPLSILEAQAYGTVPIAFNSYASLEDVVQNGVTGVIIEKFGDCEAFADSLAELMTQKEKREAIARAAFDSSERFSQERIGGEWKRMIENL